MRTAGIARVRVTAGRIAVRASQPILRLHLAHYARDVASAPFPVDARGSRIGGGGDRLLFVGDVAVAGYGVLLHRMAVPSRTAVRVARERGTGIEWRTLASADLTAAAASAAPLPAADVAILMLGVPDVLLATSASQWTAALERLIRRVRERSRAGIPVVLAGLPPMADFRPMPRRVAHLLRRQSAHLDAASRALAARLGDVAFVPFPDLPGVRTYVENAYRWQDLHGIWADALAPAVLAALGSGERAGHSRP